MSLYKYILNVLPLLYQPLGPPSPFSDGDEDIELGPPRPADKRARRPRLSVSGRARQTWTKKHTRAWFSVVAGGIAGGAAIIFEKRSRRIDIGQQMFVRSVESVKVLTTHCSSFDAQGAPGIVQRFGCQVWVYNPVRCSLALLHRLLSDYVRLHFTTGHASEGLHLLDRPSWPNSAKSYRH